MWILLAFISSVFLGAYDITKKLSLNNNAVIPVLFFASLMGALMMLPLLLLSNLNILPENSILFVASINVKLHGMIFLKSALVCTSWLFSYYALKNLPITIVTPIRATGPMWTLIGALLIYNEQYSVLQWIGIVVVIGFFYYFSLAGNREGINFKNNRWILFIVLATLLGSISSLYDKYLFANFDRMAIQTWFSIYMVLIYIPVVMLMWYPRRKKTTPFRWHWAIPLIGILLTLADFAYFYALTDKEALITIVSVLRRTSVVIAFAIGAILFKEINLKRKAVALFGILVGVLIIVFGS